MNKNHLTILIGCIVVSALTLFSADNPEVAPLNPDFIAWQVSLSGAQRSECLVSKDGYGLGYIPSPVDWSHLYQQKPRYQHLPLGAPPSYDLRTLNGMTFVRDQGSCGSCWAFGTYGSLESYLRKTLGQTWDFSEQNMKNMHGYDWSACAGGNCDIILICNQVDTIYPMPIS